MNNKLLLCGIGAIAAMGANAQDNRPNIIYIMCDDMGYADLGCYGQQYISTPNIDRMAAEGMRFTQAYCGCPVSAPSRASFMTGQHTGHTKIRGNKERKSGEIYYGENKEFAVTGQEPYDTAHVIIPEIMKENGYNTGMFGKWAGGYEGSESTPEKRGIDEYYGYICQYEAHLYYPNFLNAFSRSAGDTEVRREIMEENIKYPMVGPGYENRTQYSADLIHNKALEWLDKQQPGKPFIGIFTYTPPHAELVQPQDSIYTAYEGKFCNDKPSKLNKQSRYNVVDGGHKAFAALITRLDTQVGQILDKLKEKGLDENTIVIFTSDNGPHSEAGADPEFFNQEKLLRGIKRSTTEGGIRIPFIARWPGTIKAGTVNDHQFAFYDLMATFCDIAGIKDYQKKYTNPRLKEDYFDGISIYPTLTGKGVQKKHHHLYWEIAEGNMIGVRMGNWKLVVKKGVCQLYDLATDLHEDHDLSTKYPEILKEMKEIVRKEHVDSPIFHITLP